MTVRDFVLIGCLGLSLIGCTPPKETFPLAPSAREGVEIAEARGYRLGVSRQAESDVSVFGLVHEQVIVLWVRIENYSKSPVSVSPDQIRISGVDESSRPKSLKIFSPGKAEAFKNLGSSLAGVYQMLKNREASPGARLAELKAEWSEKGIDYQSLQQVLFSARTLQLNETAEGYIVAQYLPAVSYSIVIPIGRNTHRFDLAPVRPAAS